MVVLTDEHGGTEGVSARAQGMDVMTMQRPGALRTKEFPYGADAVTREAAPLASVVRSLGEHGASPKMLHASAAVSESQARIPGCGTRGYPWRAQLHTRSTSPPRL